MIDESDKRLQRNELGKFEMVQEIFFALSRRVLLPGPGHPPAECPPLQHEAGRGTFPRTL